jgi:hypothetical protein
LDEGKSLDYRETVKHVENGTLFEWLKSTFSNEIDLSLYTEEDFKPMLQLFKNLANAVDARRKMGVEYNGICLLLAYCIEGIQELN